MHWMFTLPIKREAKAPHDCSRRHVLRLVDADHRIEFEFLERVTHPGSCCFGRETLAAVALAKSPADLDRRKDLREERRDR